MTRVQKRKRDRRHTLAALLVLAALAVGCVFALKWGYDRFTKTAYPLPYRDEVETWAAEYEVAPSLVYAVMATESSFDPEAVSVAGAIGLMQLTPDTFHWARMRMGTLDEDLSVDDLFDPAVNIRYGTYVLRLLRDDFESTATLLAAYNAGRTTAMRWLDDERYSSDGVTLRDIPIAETRQYVLKVLQAQETYQELYGLS
ncbi:MAG: lytic transglycosylase domain-containing protein [Acutalibacteraceae bacterium]|jgi:soluble lytic murein transglycosylase